MEQLIISLGAAKKQILDFNKTEAKNYLNELKKPVFILSEYDEEYYRKDSEFTHLPYQLLDNIKTANLICVERSGSTIQALSAVLARLKDGLLIIDMPNNKEQSSQMFEFLSNTKNKNIQVLINLPSIELLEDSLHKIHTGWRLFSPVNKKDFDSLKESIGELDAVGLTLTGALRDEYIKTYKDWCKSEKRKPEPVILNLPFYYSFSKIIIKKEVFDELIESVLTKLKLFEIEYTSDDVKEMYL